MRFRGGMNLNFFSEKDLARTYQAGIDILKQVGIRTDSDRFKTLLSDHGCKVDNDVVKFTDGVIEKDARVACVLTGHPLKDPNLTVNYHKDKEG